MKGKVYLVGAGPGKPDLITVRGFNILRQADVVIYDYLVDGRILEEIKPEAECISADSLGKKRYKDGFSEAQGTINNIMVAKAKEGKLVVRLKNGDPAIFGRLSQELEALTKNNLEFEIVPGITAASAASAFTGIPLTDRRFASSCVFVTGHEDYTKKESSIDWAALARSGTIVLYMAAENLKDIAAQLIKAGKAITTPLAIIKDASLERQKVIRATLKEVSSGIKEWTVKAPAIIIIGEVVNMEKKFNWLKRSRKVLFTGLSPERFSIKGAYFHLPLIKIVPMDDYEEFDDYLKNIRQLDWIIFASRYGAEYFFERLEAIGRDTRVLNGIKIAAIGSSTKNRLLDFGIIADLVPQKESSEGLLERFQKENIKGKKIFMPRSDLADKNLKEGFERLGARMTTSFAYKNIMPANLPDLELDFFDEIMFTSPSTVRNFKKRYKRAPEKIRISCIGDVTLKEAKRCRLLG